MTTDWCGHEVWTCLTLACWPANTAAAKPSAGLQPKSLLASVFPTLLVIRPLSHLKESQRALYSLELLQEAKSELIISDDCSKPTFNHRWRRGEVAMQKRTKFGKSATRPLSQQFIILRHGWLVTETGIWLHADIHAFSS